MQFLFAKIRLHENVFWEIAKFCEIYPDTKITFISYQTDSLN